MAWNRYADSLYSNFLYHLCGFVSDILEKVQTEKYFH